MFTGIITDIGTITAITQPADTRFVIAVSADTDTMAIGASIACSGVCLTVVEKGTNWFAVDASDATLSCTNLHSWSLGTHINLERSLKMGDELGGHWVSGHVDGLAHITDIHMVGGSHCVTLRAPDILAKYIAEKGSVTLDGVSLTVNSVDNTLFTVNIIPHTWAITTWNERKPKDSMHLEIDVIARYLQRMISLQH